jgi:hypothetical protein
MTPWNYSEVARECVAELVIGAASVLLGHVPTSPQKGQHSKWVLNVVESTISLSNLIKSISSNFIGQSHKYCFLWNFQSKGGTLADHENNKSIHG